MKIETHKNITQDILTNNPDTLFIIEDSDKLSNYNSMCSQIKFDNLISLKIKKNNTKKRGDLYNDKNLNINKENILSNFLDIRAKLMKYDKVSLKETGYGIYLKSYSPKTYDFMFNLIEHNLHFNNNEGVYKKRIPSYNEINNSEEIDISNYNAIKTKLIKTSKSRSIITDDESIKFGDVIRIKHKEISDEIICLVTTPVYNIRKINLEKLNLFEGYTKPSNGNLQFQINYIGNISSGVITFADDAINKTYPVNKEVVQKEKNTELGIDVISEMNKEITKQTKPFKLEVEEVVEILEQPKEIKPNKIEKYESPSWFGVDDFKTNLDNYIKSICSDTNPSILDLKNSNYFIASDTYLHEINYFDGRFTIINKIKLIDYKLVDVFGIVNLFTKEKVYGQERIDCFKINTININIIDKFLKSKF